MLCKYKRCMFQALDDKKFCSFHYKERKSDIIATIIALILVSLWILGNIAMLVCGALGISGHLNINLGGSIAMVVIGSLFGGMPFIKSIFRGGK